MTEKEYEKLLDRIKFDLYKEFIDPDTATYGIKYVDEDITPESLTDREILQDELGRLCLIQNKYVDDEEYRGFNNFGDGSRIASHLVHDFHYNSQYLYPNVDSCDHEYTWIIWTGKSDVWLSAYNQYTNRCEFVGTPDKLINRYKQKNMGYTNWTEKFLVEADAINRTQKNTN